MAVEKMRGCGYRKVGGLYLCGEGISMSCDRLPYELKVCPVCGNGIKFSRGFQWINWMKYAGPHYGECSDTELCPICYPDAEYQPYGLLWVGESYYTPESFIQEAIQMGVSRRIAAVPRKLKLGETWVLFAHMTACGTRKVFEEGSTVPHEEKVPGVFYAFRPTRIEKLIWESEAKPEYLEDLQKNNITPVIIPDGDPDHDPNTKLIPDETERLKLQNEKFFSELRSKLRR